MAPESVKPVRVPNEVTFVCAAVVNVPLTLPVQLMLPVTSRACVGRTWLMPTRLLTWSSVMGSTEAGPRPAAYEISLVVGL